MDEFKKLGNEYKISKIAIKSRIELLVKDRTFLENKLKIIKYEHKREEIELKITELNDRLRPLNAIYRDLSEIGREASNYYKRSWWRSEKYTCNKRKSRRTVFVPYYDTGEDE